MSSAQQRAGFSAFVDDKGRGEKDARPRRRRRDGVPEGDGRRTDVDRKRAKTGSPPRPKSKEDIDAANRKARSRLQARWTPRSTRRRRTTRGAEGALRAKVVEKEEGGGVHQIRAESLEIVGRARFLRGLDGMHERKVRFGPVSTPADQVSRRDRAPAPRR